MKKCKEILIGVLLLSMVFFTACTSKAAKAMGNRQISRRMDTHGIIVVERFATFHYY